jgi:hypothetical protein
MPRQNDLSLQARVTSVHTLQLQSQFQLLPLTEESHYAERTTTYSATYTTKFTWFQRKRALILTDGLPAVPRILLVESIWGIKDVYVFAPPPTD